MKQIRGSLYGYISVNPAELEVIGSPAVQRLRGIQQCGLSSAVYPGATHSRFEHSLGVMHLAGELAESIGLSDAEVQAYRLGGLLHDVGHAPFSHATESVMEKRLGISHEEQSCRIVDGIANAMGETFPADPELVKDAIMGDSQYDIIAGEVDTDRMDYLRRDAAETGIPHGEIDTETIIRFAESRDGDVVFSYKSLQAIEDLFNARNAMTKSVYEHHTSKIVEMMLQRAVENFLDETDVDPEVLLRWDDNQLHTHLLEHENGAEDMYTVKKSDGEWLAPLPESTADSLYERIASRNLYKRALTIGIDEYTREELRELTDRLSASRKIESEIASIAGVEPKEVLVDVPTIPANETPDVGILMGDDVKKFSAVSHLPETIAEAELRTSYIGVYTPESHCQSVRDAAQSVLF